ncbi:MAG: circadian clock protein LdpA [Leptolyngbyaceae cyanobacterium]
MRNTNRSVISLQAGCWFKLIGGASYQHLPSIRNLALVYTLAGADCIDVAADPAVVSAVKEAFQVISWLRQLPQLTHRYLGELPIERPLLMVSFSDGDDPHFRKAQFDPALCPADCTRPCERICPAAAIAFPPVAAGVITDRCYGCGRCLPVCPIQNINTVTRATSVETIAAALLEQVDAIEIHTQVGRYEPFMALWSRLRPYLSHLAVISISCPDHDDAVEYLWQLYEGIRPHWSKPLIWQTDGRPMSGDIGKGTTHATLRFAAKVLRSGPPGYVQLAGGTNDHTVAKLSELVDAQPPSFPAEVWGLASNREASRPRLGGVAFGSFARRLMSSGVAEPSLEPLFASAVQTHERLPHYDQTSLTSSIAHLAHAVALAHNLITPLKRNSPTAAGVPSSTAGDGPCPTAVSPESPVYLSTFE